MPIGRKVLLVLGKKVKTPPFSAKARVEAGHLIGRLQRGASLSMPESRPMPSIGTDVHELRIDDGKSTRRIIYRIDPGAILLLEAFTKKTEQTPTRVIKNCKARIKNYDSKQTKKQEKRKQ